MCRILDLAILPTSVTFEGKINIFYPNDVVILFSHVLKKYSFITSHYKMPPFF